MFWYASGYLRAVLNCEVNPNVSRETTTKIVIAKEYHWAYIFEKQSCKVSLLIFLIQAFFFSYWSIVFYICSKVPCHRNTGIAMNSRVPSGKSKSVGFKSFISFLNLITCSQSFLLEVSLKRALQYPFNWIRFLEINKLCNVIAENLTFSTNQKLISITCIFFKRNRFIRNLELDILK